MGLDRSLHQGRRAPLCGLRSGVLCQIVWRQQFRGRYLRRYDGRSGSGIRDHGLLHVHEDGGDDETQGSCQRCEAPGHDGDLHGHLPSRGHCWYQQGCERRGGASSHQLGLTIRSQQSCVSPTIRAIIMSRARERVGSEKRATERKLTHDL